MSLRLRVLAVAALPVLLWSCDDIREEPQRQPAGAPLEAAIVPGANLVIQADLQAVRQAPIFAVLAPMLADEAEEAEDDAAADDPADDPADDSEATEGETSPESKFDEDRFLEAVGLQPGDFISLVLSARIDPADLPAPAGDEAGEPAEGEGEEAPFDPEALFGAIDRTPAAFALLLAREFDLGRLEEGLRLASADGAEGRLTRVEVAGAPALRVASVEEGEPDSWAAILGGNTLFVAFNEASLAGAVERARSGALAETAPEVQQARAALPGTSQGSLVFLAPEALREMIRQKIAEAGEDPSAAAMLGFVRPFENLRSIGMGVEAGEDLKVATSYDLGDAAVASQAQAMFGGMLMPMAQAGLAQAAGRTPAEMADRLVISSQDTTLSLVYRMTADDAVAFEEIRKRKAEEEAAEAEAEGGEEDPGL